MNFWGKFNLLDDNPATCDGLASIQSWGEKKYSDPLAWFFWNWWISTSLIGYLYSIQTISCLNPRQSIKTLRYEEQFLSTVLNISICLAYCGGQQEVPSLKISWYTGTSGLEIFPSWNNKIKYYIITQSGLVHGGTSNHSIFTPAKWFNTSELSPYFNGFWERKTPDNQFFDIYFNVKNKIIVKILQDL